jgi:hypothetical protein
VAATGPARPAVITTAPAIPSIDRSVTRPPSRQKLVSPESVVDLAFRQDEPDTPKAQRKVEAPDSPGIPTGVAALQIRPGPDPASPALAAATIASAPITGSRLSPTPTRSPHPEATTSPRNDCPTMTKTQLG